MSKNPIPQGKYKPAVRYGNLIFTAGMTPRKDGVLLMSGKISPDRPLDDYRDAVIQAASNALTAAQNTLGEGEKIVQILSLTVYLNATEDYTTHAKVGDIVSGWLYEQLGDAGVGAGPPSAWPPSPATPRWRSSSWPPPNKPGYKTNARLWGDSEACVFWFHLFLLRQGLPLQDVHKLLAGDGLVLVQVAGQLVELALVLL